ncbi:MAG: helix-turn-helix domain-containing protein [Cytophagaceae bacterium]
MSEQALKSSNLIHKGDDYLIGFSQYFSNPNNLISKALNKRTKPINLDLISYRQLNSWEKEGLLNCDRIDERGWRKFSLIDSVWLLIINELREFGYPIKMIQKVKIELSEFSPQTNTPMPLLEFHTAFALNGMPVFLLIFKDASISILNYEQYKLNKEVFGIQNHLLLNINSFLQKLIPNKNLPVKYKKEIELNGDELTLISLLRLGSYERVEIKYKNGKMDLFTLEEKMETKEKIIDIIHQHNYQEITLVVNDKKTVSIIRKVKKKANIK